MTTAQLAQLLAALGAGTVIAATVTALSNGMFSRKKTRVDVVAVITDASGDAVALAAQQRSELVADMQRLQSEMREVKAKVGTLEENARVNRRWRHSATEYINELREVLAEHNIPSPAPPADLGLDDRPIV